MCGFIICMMSCVVEIGGLGVYVYIVFKYGFFGLVRLVCGDLGKYGIRVNGVVLYVVVMRMNSFDEEMVRMVEEYFVVVGIFKGVVFKVGYVVQVVLFLVLDDLVYVSGYNFVVDGGYSVVKNVDLDFFK